MAKLTRENILEAGLDLLSVCGFSGISLGPLAERVGLSKSGLFAHFRSKGAVQLALLERSGRLADRQIVSPAMAMPPGLPRLRALVNGWLGWTSRAGLKGGCPVAAAMFELDDVEGGIRDAVAAMEASWRGLLGQTVQEAVQLGHLSADLDVAQFVWELCGIYLGHHVSLRFNRAPSADMRAQQAFEALLRRAGASD
ncbi:TetR/AcrR family transcriptional regulator [Arenibaculum pallidiluteum]|uniref:TetR/AcrR family transcriptional regulator n=1 Tax=Arenibaculum pallidiluteum TaxID=2812559 RepID=UPI001A960085|nr:TetR/AcrR family transcriptional regulator [Arenibaculum pallidiluteum]